MSWLEKLIFGGPSSRVIKVASDARQDKTRVNASVVRQRDISVGPVAEHDHPAALSGRQLVMPTDEVDDRCVRLADDNSVGDKAIATGLLEAVLDRCDGQPVTRHSISKLDGELVSVAYDPLCTALNVNTRQR